MIQGTIFSHLYIFFIYFIKNFINKNDKYYRYRKKNCEKQNFCQNEKFVTNFSFELFS